MSIAKQMAVEVKKCTGNKLELKLGDRVTHSLSRIKGVVEEISIVGDQHLLSVRTAQGKLLTRLARQEFLLGW